VTDQTASFPLRDRHPAGRVHNAASALPWPVVLYFFTVVIPIHVQLGPLLMTTLRAMLLVLFVPLTIRLLSGLYGRMIATDYLFAAFLFWSTLVIALKNPGQVLQFSGSTGIEFFGGYLIGRAYIRTPEAVEALTRLMILFLALTLPFAVYEALTSRALLLDALRALPGLDTVGDNGSELRSGLFRVQLTFSHQIHYGLFASLAFALTFIGLKDRISTARRYLACTLIAVCIYLSLSSGALLALVMQVFLIGWQTAFRNVRLRWHLLAALCVLAYVVIDVLSDRTPVRVFMSYATFSPHTAYYRALIFDYGMDNVWANPVFGLGLNDWVRPSYMLASVDNFWLLAAMRFGILGFLLVAAGYLSGLVQVIRRDFSGDARLRQIRLAWVITFLGMIFTLSTVALWTNVYSFVFFMFAAGMWLITAQPADAPAAAAPPPGRAGAITRRPATAQPAAAPASPAPDERPEGPRYTRFPPSSSRSGPGSGPRSGPSNPGGDRVPTRR
jgi:hypothetical protein